jgi:hypothetical protein
MPPSRNSPRICCGKLASHIPVRSARAPPCTARGCPASSSLMRSTRISISFTSPLLMGIFLLFCGAVLAICPCLKARGIRHSHFRIRCGRTHRETARNNKNSNLCQRPRTDVNDKKPAAHPSAPVKTRNQTEPLPVRTSPFQSERSLVSEREPVQEERATVQDEGWQSAGAWQQRSVARSARHAEQVSAWLVGLLLQRGRAARHSAASTGTSMSACATSSPHGTKWQGVAHAGSPVKLSMVGLLRLERLPLTAR